MLFTSQTLKQGILETMSTFEHIHMPEGPSLVDMCLINSATFDMLYFNDINADFRPPSMKIASTTSATLIASDNNELLKFVNPSKCVSVPEGCYSYCRDTCFRTLRFEILGLASWRVKLCLQDSSPSLCVMYKAGRRGGVEYSIMVHAPVGQSYIATIVDKTGKTVVPKLQKVFFEQNNCGGTRFQVSVAGQDNAIPFVPWSDF
jgi:hypothetical protein